MLRRFVELTRQELYDIDVCGECYRNANTAPATWRTMVCAAPHILVWARMIGDRRYWPAKAMAIKRVGRVRVYVRFFTDNSPNAYVDPADCYLFSKMDPSGHTIDMQEHRVSAIACPIRQMFGTCCFNFGPFRIVFFQTGIGATFTRNEGEIQAIGIQRQQQQTVHTESRPAAVAGHIAAAQR